MSGLRGCEGKAGCVRDRERVCVCARIHERERERVMHRYPCDLTQGPTMPYSAPPASRDAEAIRARTVQDQEAGGAADGKVYKGAAAYKSYIKQDLAQVTTNNKLSG